MGIKAKVIYFPKVILKILLSAVGKSGIYDQLFGDLEVDATKSREHLHWTPPVTLHEAMKKTAKYYIEGNK
jgi:nucleoside-diphosphate-sugar epimerase